MVHEPGPPSTSVVLGRLIVDNARERRSRYKLLKESGTSIDDVAVWPSTESAASAEVRASTSKIPMGGEVAHADRTAHLLLRVLGLCFVVPLMRIDDEGIPANTERYGITVFEALDTVESMMQEQPGTLDDIFQSRPGGAGTDMDVFSSTTLDLWFCPRLLVASSIVSLRASGILPATRGDTDDKEAQMSALSEADHLRKALIDRTKSMLRCSILKVHHRQSIRAILWEFLLASHQALVQVDDSLGKVLPFKIDFHKRIVDDEHSELTKEGPSLRFTSFFTSKSPTSSQLTTPKPGPRPPGEGIARLWMPEDRTNFELRLPVKYMTPHIQHSLSRTLLCCSTNIILSLVAEFPALLDDIGQAALKTFFITWRHDIAFCQSDLKAREIPSRIIALQYEVIQDCLHRPQMTDSCLEREFLAILPHQIVQHLGETSISGATAEELTDVMVKLEDILRTLRLSKLRIPIAAWSSLRRLTGIFLHLLQEPLSYEDTEPDGQLMTGGQAEQARNGNKLPRREAVAIKLCAYEGLLTIVQLSPLLSPLSAVQERDAIQALCGENFNAVATSAEEETLPQHPWLSIEKQQEVRRTFRQLIHDRMEDHKDKQKKKRKRWQAGRSADSDARAAIPVNRESLIKDGLLDVAFSTNHDMGHPSLDNLVRSGLFICGEANCLVRRAPHVGDAYQKGTVSCSLCDASDYPGPVTQEQEVETLNSDQIRFLSTLYGDQRIKEASLIRALDTIVRQIAHYPSDRFLEVADSGALDALVRQGLTHSHREARLAAGRLAFAIAAKHVSIERDGDVLNLRKRLISLHSIHERLLDVSSPKIKETVIISLGGLGRIYKEEILEAVLLRLVLQLSSTVLLQSCAYLQITQLAAYHKCSTYALLSPYFAAISPPIVEKMTSAPSLFLEVLNLTNQNQAKFLQVTLTWTLPQVIASQNTKALDLMVGVLGTTIPKLCLEQAPAILKQYLLLPATKRDRNIRLYLDTIRRASDQEVPLKGLYRSYIGEILGHLVACLGDEDNRALALDGLRHIRNTLTVERNEKSKAKAAMSGGGDLSAFLREEILGILAWLNDDLMSFNGKRSPTYKAMVARSIGVFIEVVGSSISIVAPQIMATLSSTLQVSELRLATLQSWQTFMTTLRFDDVGPFIGQTTAALLSEWSQFNKAERKVAGQILNYLVVENAQEMKKFSAEIPNMEDLASELPDVCRKLRSSRQEWSAEQQLQHILDRVADENASINLRSLHELKGFLQSHRRYVQTQASGSVFAPIVGTIITAVLGTLRRSDDTQLEMRDLCLECLGMLGAVDPDRLDLPAEDSPHKLLQNFEDRDETIDFAVHLIRDILVSAFRATSDTKHQSALAYAIQELLRFCGFTSALLRPGGRITSLKVKQRWNELPPAIIDTVAPLLDSKYSITHGPTTTHSKPFYQHSNSYREWIEIWANHLMQGATGQDAETIFGIFRVLIRHHDLDITQHILPHAVLHNLISGTEQQRDELSQEFVAVLLDQVDPTMGFSPDRRLLCAQTVFGLMDHMSAWLRLKRMERAKQPRRRETGGLGAGDESLINVESVIASISQELMARAALYCRAYARSLLNFEQRIRTFRASGKPDGELQPYYENLHTIYANLDEPDGMEGISTCIISPSLEHQIREHESTGRWTSAQSCWEVEIQSKPDDASNHVGLLRCLRNLGHYDTMRTHVRGALSVHPQWEGILGPFAIEGACILGDWDEAEQVLSRPGQQESPEHAMARVLLAMAGRGTETISTVLKTARRQLGKPILAAGRNSYHQVYDAVLQLHILHEASLIQELSQTTDRGGKKLDELIRSLQARLDSTLPSFRIREPLLSVRRSAFSTYVKAGSTEPAFKAEIAAAWISTCKIARKAGHTQTAYSAVLQAMVNQAPFAFVQRAKLLADGDQPHAAMQELTNALQTMSASMDVASAATVNEAGVIDLTGVSPASEIDKAMYGKAYLLKARLFEATGRFMANEVIEQYKDSAKHNSRLEKAWYYLGRYYDTRGGATVVNMMTQNFSVCRYFVKSAQLGTKFFYRTLPRLLTIWLDAGEEQLILEHQNGRYRNASDRNKNPEANDRVETFNKINDMISRSVGRLQPYQWLAVFPQLVSRIVHKNESVWAVLQTIIAVVVERYSHQAMWGMVAAFQSTDGNRKRRANAIVEKVKGGRTASREAVHIIQMSQKLAHELLVLCDHPVQKTEATLKMETSFPALAALAGCGLILPLQSSVTVNLPANNEVKADHSPFPPNLPLIQGFESTIEIMNSLQKPRKIVIIGSDGKHYPFLCKPKDDLRKDARLMEFDSMINKLLQSNSESRKRHLLIRTYAVVTLNEECGLIEWVPNTIGLRHILHKLYASKGIPLYSNELRMVTDECRKESPRKAAELFETKVLSRYPPVFHEWFLNTFPEPAAWLKARLSYARTAAVMSMVGFVLGLGDRHGENILFDSVSGDTVHVDLNCLFEKGQTFEIPEQVPFRLTRNMIDAMGVTGYEGVFRRAAELTMGILRSNKDSLMSVLEAMIHDPLVEWAVADGGPGGGGGGGGGGRSKQARESTSVPKQDPRLVEARKSLDPVARKLDGTIRKGDLRSDLWTSPLGNNNLVDTLTREAASNYNLSRMYVGWSAWL